MAHMPEAMRRALESNTQPLGLDGTAVPEARAQRNCEDYPSGKLGREVKPHWTDQAELPQTMRYARKSWNDKPLRWQDGQGWKTKRDYARERALDRATKRARRKAEEPTSGKRITVSKARRKVVRRGESRGPGWALRQRAWM